MVGYTLVILASTFVLAQAFTTLPLAMRGDGLSPQAYGLAMAINGVLIVLVQPVVNNWLTGRDHSRVIAGGLVLLGAGVALHAPASTPGAHAAAVAVWTLGEIAVAAVGQAVVADLAPEHLRGRYGALWGGGLVGRVPAGPAGRHPAAGDRCAGAVADLHGELRRGGGRNAGAGTRDPPGPHAGAARSVTRRPVR